MSSNDATLLFLIVQDRPLISHKAASSRENARQLLLAYYVNRKAVIRLLNLELQEAAHQFKHVQAIRASVHIGEKNYAAQG